MRGYDVYAYEILTSFFSINNRQIQTMLGIFRKGTEGEELPKICNCCTTCNCTGPALQVSFSVFILCLKILKKGKELENEQRRAGKDHQRRGMTFQAWGRGQD